MYNSIFLSGLEFKCAARDFLCPWHWLHMDFITVCKRNLRRLYFYTCLSVHRGGGWYPSMHCRFLSTGVVSQHALQVSRPTPRGEVEGSGLKGGGSPGPHPGGLQAHTWGWVSQHALRQTPLQADGYCCGQYASCWNAFLLFEIVHKGSYCLFSFRIGIENHKHIVCTVMN